jgi:pyrimidine operon attenuation protein/uracil phosphoribosyltransferase
MAERQRRHAERRILDAADLARCLTRLAHEVVERNRTVDQMVFVGIRTRGVPLARRLQHLVRQITGVEPPLGVLDISLYRDDLSHVASSPVVGRTEIDFPLDDRVVVLVDDVLYTGRTTRAALDALVEFGRPRRIQLAVVIDRGHREYPIRADYVGKNVPTSSEEIVHVRLRETDTREEVIIAYRNEH